MVGAYFYKSFLTLNNAFKKITIIFPLAMFVFYKVDIGYSMQEGPVCIMPGHTGLFHCLIPHCRENWEVAKKSVETIDGGNNFFFLSFFFFEPVMLRVTVNVTLRLTIAPAERWRCWITLKSVRRLNLTSIVILSE